MSALMTFLEMPASFSFCVTVPRWTCGYTWFFPCQPILWAHRPMLTHSFLLLSHLSVPVWCGTSYSQIISWQGLFFVAVWHRGQPAATAKMKQSITVNCMPTIKNWFVTFLFFYFLFEKLSVPLGASSKIGKSSLSSMVDVTYCRVMVHEVRLFLLSYTCCFWVPKIEEAESC